MILAMLNQRICIGVLAIVSVCTIAASSRAQTTAPSTQPSSEEAKQVMAYAIGQQVGNSLKQVPFEVNIDLFIQGCKDALAGANPKFDADVVAAARTKLQAEVMATQLAAQQAEFTKNQAAGTEYLATNGKKTGVRTLPSGVQIETVTPGTGESPKATDNVKVHYTGKLIDGKVFDSSRGADGSGEPVTLPLSRVIPGWTEGIQQMKVGEKAILTIPQEHAYGPEGSPPVIPPGSTLVFEVELLGISPPTTAPAMPGMPAMP
jgi:FKBP-type peptidyl-prolyl cis-trans isomerase FklB